MWPLPHLCLCIAPCNFCSQHALLLLTRSLCHLHHALLPLACILLDGQPSSSPQFQPFFSSQNILAAADPLVLFNISLMYLHVLGATCCLCCSMHYASVMEYGLTVTLWNSWHALLHSFHSTWKLQVPTKVLPIVVPFTSTMPSLTSQECPRKC